MNCDFHSASIEAILSQKSLNSMQGFQKFNVMNCVTWTWIQMPLQKGVCLIVLYGRRLVTILPNSDWRWQGVRKSLRLSWQVADNRTMLFYSKLFLMVFRWFFLFAFCQLILTFSFPVTYCENTFGCQHKVSTNDYNSIPDFVILRRENQYQSWGSFVAKIFINFL